DLNIQNGYLNFDFKTAAGKSFEVTAKIKVDRLEGSSLTSEEYTVSFPLAGTAGLSTYDAGGQPPELCYRLGDNTGLNDGKWHSALSFNLNLKRIVDDIAGKKGETGVTYKLNHVSAITLEGDGAAFKNISLSADSLLTDIKPISVKKSQWVNVDGTSGHFSAPNESELTMKMIERRNFKYNGLQQTTGYRDTVWSSDNPAIETVKRVSANVYNGLGQLISSDEMTETRQNSLTVNSPGTSLYGIVSKKDNVLYKDADLTYYENSMSPGDPLDFLSFEINAKYMEALRADDHGFYVDPQSPDTQSSEDFVLYVAAKVNDTATNSDKTEDVLIAVHITGNAADKVDGWRSPTKDEKIDEARGVKKVYDYYLLNHVDDNGNITDNSGLAIYDFGATESNGKKRIVDAREKGTLAIDRWFRIENINLSAMISDGPENGKILGDSTTYVFDHIKWFYIRGGSYTLRNMTVAEDKYKTHAEKISLSKSDWQVYASKATIIGNEGPSAPKSFILDINTDSSHDTGISPVDAAGNVQSLNYTGRNYMIFDYKNDTEALDTRDTFAISVSVTGRNGKAYSLTYYTTAEGFNKYENRSGGWMYIGMANDTGNVPYQNKYNVEYEAPTEEDPDGEKGDGFTTVMRDINQDLLDQFGTGLMRIGSVSMSTRGGKYQVRNLRFTAVTGAAPIAADTSGNIDYKASGVKDKETRVQRVSLDMKRWRAGTGNISITSAGKVTTSQRWDMKYNTQNQLLSYKEKSSSSTEQSVVSIKGAKDTPVSVTASPSQPRYPWTVTSGTAEFTLFVGDMHEDMENNNNVVIRFGSGRIGYRLTI
ncbi:MAG: hypothetical protein KJ994_01030, partial [Candidatus Omnitrophica bacterium]|nr:hypothetical protein [Candidatus Omnitrophota bacterium]